MPGLPAWPTRKRLRAARQRRGARRRRHMPRLREGGSGRRPRPSVRLQLQLGRERRLLGSGQGSRSVRALVGGLDLSRHPTIDRAG